MIHYGKISVDDYEAMFNALTFITLCKVGIKPTVEVRAKIATIAHTYMFESIGYISFDLAITEAVRSYKQGIS